jgi:hypothetical protein
VVASVGWPRDREPAVWTLPYFTLDGWCDEGYVVNLSRCKVYNLDNVPKRDIRVRADEKKTFGSRLKCLM